MNQSQQAQDVDVEFYNIEDNDDETISPLKDWQEVIIAVLPVISSILSIVGSSTIVRLTLRRKLSTPYDRILFGLSIADMVSSATNALNPYLAPRDTSPRIFAIGNDTTCAAIGFLWHISTAGFMYSGMLSLYYYLTVRHSISIDYIQSKIEFYMHCGAFLGPFISGLIGFLPGYKEVRLGPGCWTRASWFGYAFTAAPMIIMIPAIIYFQISIFLHVRTTLLKSGARSFWSFTKDRDGSSSTNNNNDNPTTKKLRLVATQNFLYVGAFLVVNSFPTVLRMLDDNGYRRQSEDDLYILLVLQSFFLPIQGFLNVLIYVRPRYMTRRTKHPNESRYYSLKTVLNLDDDGSGTGLYSSEDSSNQSGTTMMFTLLKRQLSKSVSFISKRRSFDSFDSFDRADFDLGDCCSDDDGGVLGGGKVVVKDSIDISTTRRESIDDEIGIIDSIEEHINESSVEEDMEDSSEEEEEEDGEQSEDVVHPVDVDDGYESTSTEMWSESLDEDEIVVVANNAGVQPSVVDSPV